MFTDKVSDYVEGVAAKYLTAVDANPEKSNQHEFGGLPGAGFIKYLGRPAKGQKPKFNARMVYFGNRNDEIESVESKVTWYDVRHGTRSPEYRLYYDSNAVTKLIKETDFFLIAKMKDGSLLMIFCQSGNEIEAQLRSVFGLSEVSEKFKPGKFEEELILPVRMLLEDLGLISFVNDSDTTNAVDRLIKKFGNANFPSTSAMSAFARSELKDLDALKEPDSTLMSWMEHEESLFRALEKQQISIRLKKGFGKNGDDVDEFIRFSLSVQNRRKARVGHAFESHLEAIFNSHGLPFERGVGKGRVTENKSRPDFIFPGFSSYHDKKFPANKLLMLGAKTTCKDRWRQVLAEAARIERKHLVTIEVGISDAQTDSMKSHNLQLVVPAQIKKTYTAKQKAQIITLSEFIGEVKAASAKRKS